MANLAERLRRLYYKKSDSYSITINGEKFYCDTHHMKFWSAVNQGNWEPQTIYILSKFLTPTTNYCDIGAWIGPTVLYAAKKCKTVYCFEPDRISYEYLLANIRRNNLQNVIPFNLAIRDRDGFAKIGTFAKTFGRSKTSLLKGESQETMTIPALSWNSVTQLFNPHIDFLKIDIEGAEFELIPHMKDYLYENKPIVYLSLHPQFLKQEEREQGVKQIIETMRIYRKCYDEFLNELAPQDFMTPQHIQTGNTFLFLD